MDLSILPDLATHFYAAAQVAGPMVMEGLDNAYNTIANIWTGATHPEAMPSVERNIQLIKIGSSAFGLYASAISGNYHAALACSIAGGETLIRLNKAGFTQRELDKKPAP